MSNIPFDAISGSLTPVQRQNNESLRARRVQAQKNIHHAEDVEELDDAAVDSIREQAQHGGQEQGGAERDPQEQVDIESLDQPTSVPARSAPAKASSHLDISA